MTAPDSRLPADAPGAPQGATDAAPACAGPRIHLHVDRLQLRGIGAEQARPLIEQLSAHLRRRWSDHEAVRELISGGSRSRRTVRNVTVRAGNDATDLGEAFADALAREIAR